MTQFTKSFLWRFILDLILIGFFARILQALILAVLSRFMETPSVPFLIIEAVVISSIDMLLICFIANWNIKVIAKKGCYDYPQDHDKWFKCFAFINIGINLVFSLILFFQWREQIAEQYNRLNEFNSTIYLSDKVEQLKQELTQLNVTVIICLVLENIIGAAILFILLPKLKKTYDES